MSSVRISVLAFVFAWFPFASTALAQQTPQAFLGYELGQSFTPHHRVVEYVEHVADASPRVLMERYGTSYEGRPLVVAFVSSEANIQNLDAIRENNLRLSDMDPGPAIVWFSYNVHGNESVSAEASLTTLYELATGSESLDNTVVVIDPCLNPDGRERYVNWYRQMVGRQPNPRPEAREHDESWPGGRTNHYYFDLNRDWAWGTQQETQARLALYNRWMPHVHVDFHEQGVDDYYYFAPAAEPMHPSITPWQREFQTTIGSANARRFDADNWLYFTREIFDLFYPGYGDTWPIFNGAIGMTYEQAGSGRAGLAILTAEADTLTLAERIAHHHASAMSTVNTVSANARRVVENFAEYFEHSTDALGLYRSFVVKAKGQADRLNAITQHLEKQGVDYGFARASRRLIGFRYLNGDAESFDLEDGDLVINTDQPKAVLAGVLFEPDADLNDSLTYDITAWALPYVYSVDAYAVEDLVEADRSTSPTASPLRSDGGGRPYAYALPWTSPEDARVLGDLLEQNVRVRYTERPFETRSDSFPRGTLIIARAGNGHLGDRFDSIVREAAARSGQEIVPIGTGLVQSGPDFGSADVHLVKAPTVALLAGEQLSPYSIGEIWHYFDWNLEYPITHVKPDVLDAQMLAKHDVLILPSGNYERAITDEQLGQVRDWVRAGGRLIAVDDALGYLAGKEGFGIKIRDAEADSAKADPDQPTELRAYAERERAALSDEVPGSIYRVRVDATHPLGFGTDGVYFTMKTSGQAFPYLKDGWNVGVIEKEEPTSGFAGHKAQESLQNTLVFGTESVGSGDVVYFVDDPLFRGFWYAGKLLFANAVFLVGQ